MRGDDDVPVGIERPGGRWRREDLDRTGYGRSLGWVVELEGRVVAVLDSPLREDMFWVSYAITPTTDDTRLAEALRSEVFWQGSGWTRLRFRSQALGLVAANVFPASRPFVGPGRINLRGLYLRPEDINAGARGWARRLIDVLLRRSR